jgi:hypothetical protein
VRTRQELEVAVDNARAAREVVWELFQDLEGFRLDEYKQMDDGGEGMARLVRYFQAALKRNGAKCTRLSATHFSVQIGNEPAFRITTDREAAKEDEQTSLLGLEHPVIKQLLDADRQLEASARALSATQGNNTKGVLTVWHVSLQDAAQRFVQRVIPIGLDGQGKRNKAIEVLLPSLGNLSPATENIFTTAARTELATTAIPDMLRRDLAHKGLLSDSVTVDRRLLAWVEFV